RSRRPLTRNPSDSDVLVGLSPAWRVEFVHRDGGTSLDDRRDRSTRMTPEIGRFRSLRCSEIREHPTSDVRASRTGTADADAQADAVRLARDRNDVAQTTVTAVPSTALHRDATELEIELVVHDDDASGRHLVERGGGLDRFAAAVHEGLRFEYDRAPEGAGGGGDETMELLAPHRGQRGFAVVQPCVDDHEPRVVTMAGVLRAGVAEAHHEPRSFVDHRLPALLLLLGGLLLVFALGLLGLGHLDVAELHLGVFHDAGVRERDVLDAKALTLVDVRDVDDDLLGHVG